MNSRLIPTKIANKKKPFFVDILHKSLGINIIKSRWGVREGGVLYDLRGNRVFPAPTNIEQMSLTVMPFRQYWVSQK